MTDLTERFLFETFADESDLEPIIKLVEKDLSEPYSMYTYRFFIYDFPRMCIMVLQKLVSSWVKTNYFSAETGPPEKFTEWPLEKHSFIEASYEGMWLCSL